MFVKENSERKKRNENQQNYDNEYSSNQMIYMNTKTDKRNFLTPTYRHNGVLTMQYYEVENVSRMFTTCHNPFS